MKNEDKEAVLYGVCSMRCIMRHIYQHSPSVMDAGKVRRGMSNVIAIQTNEKLDCRQIHGQKDVLSNVVWLNGVRPCFNRVVKMTFVCMIS